MSDIEKLFKIEIKNIGHGVSNHGFYNHALTTMWSKSFVFIWKFLPTYLKYVKWILQLLQFQKNELF